MLNKYLLHQETRFHYELETFTFPITHRSATNKGAFHFPKKLFPFAQQTLL